jgi:hypothetical protein
MQVVMLTVGWGCENLNKIVISQGITVNIKNIQIHNNAFSIFPLATGQRTDRKV